MSSGNTRRVFPFLSVFVRAPSVADSRWLCTSNGDHMLRSVLISTIVLFAVSVSPALAGEKEDVVAAAQKLVDAGNYSWTTTSEGGGDGRGVGAGGASGKTQPDGLTMLILDMRDTQAQVFMKGEKAAVETPDDGWQAVSAADAGPERRGGARDPNAPGAGGAPG